MTISDQQSQATRHQMADKLDEAAKAIETHGWSKGKLVSPEGGLCLWGAIARVTGEAKYASLAYPALAAVGKYLATEGFVPPTESSLTESAVLAILWNDCSDRTQSDVVVALQKTAIGLREQA